MCHLLKIVPVSYWIFVSFYGSIFKYHDFTYFLSENSSYFRNRYKGGVLREELILKYDKEEIACS